MEILTAQLEEYLKQAPEWQSKHILVHHTWRNRKENTNYSPETVAVKLREMERRSIIAVRHDEQGHSEYRYIPEEHRSKYIPISERPEDEEEILWRGQKKELETDKVEVPPENRARVRYEPVLDGKGRAIAMRPVPIT